MKLSEVIKAIEDGSKSEFKSKVDHMNYKLKLDKFGFIRIYMNCQSQADLPNGCDWEEVKPPRQWSEKELMLFKLLPDWAKWIARDEDGTICVYENEPNISKSGDFYQAISDNHDYEELDAFDFLTITFEESPIYIGDLKGE